jgi:penicillin-binding protein 2
VIQLPDDRRPPISPQMALRVAVLGGLALVLFAVVFFRLWYLQILSGGEYVSQANDNQVREVRVPAPRGKIVDRHGTEIVTNRQATVVQIVPGELPGEGAPRKRLYRRLGRVIGVDAERIQREVVRQRKALPYANITVKTDVSDAVLGYLRERQAAFPGVDADKVYLRQYPHEQLAAQMLGYVGQITPRQLKDDRYNGVQQGAVVGQAGLEWQYDRYLRGRDGADLLRIDSLGNQKGFLRRRQPVAGRQLKLSIDMDLQKAGQEAIARFALPGGFVAMDPRNGQIFALGSSPSFDPSVFAKPLAQSTYRALTSQTTGAPLFNRAIAGAYPTGSTFKPITAVAGLANGVITPSTVINDPGCLKVGLTEFCSPGNQGHGAVALPRALQVSSDVYFYTVGRDLDPIKGEPLQTWARRLGLGHKTGVDLPEEARGNVPDRAWREEIGRVERRCRRREHIPLDAPSYVAGARGCGISDMRPWSTGDNVNLSVGQGDVLASPLQMAVAYSTIANDGRVPRPHLGLEIDDSQGRMIQEIDPPATRRVKLPPFARDAIMQGLHAAASAPGGTSADVFNGWPHDRLPVYGKTGTAERPAQEDQSWYVAYVEHDTRPIVVAVTIERGGWGASSAAPAACDILASWYALPKAKCIPGKSRTQ